MLDAEQIQNWKCANEDAFAAAERAIDRAAKGTVACRLIHANEELPVVRALRAYRQMIDILVGELIAHEEDAARRFAEATGVYDRNGNRTS